MSDKPMTAEEVETMRRLSRERFGDFDRAFDAFDALRVIVLKAGPATPGLSTLDEVIAFAKNVLEGRE